MIPSNKKEPQRQQDLKLGDRRGDEKGNLPGEKIIPEQGFIKNGRVLEMAKTSGQQQQANHPGATLDQPIPIRANQWRHWWQRWQRWLKRGAGRDQGRSTANLRLCHSAYPPLKMWIGPTPRRARLLAMTSDQPQPALWQ